MKNNIIVNVDTDSLMIVKPDQSPWSKKEQEDFLAALNEQFPEKIKWEHDGVYTSVLVAGSKNYGLLPEPKDDKNPVKIKLKGSAFKDQKKEPAMLEMIKTIIDICLNQDREKIAETIMNVYHLYVKEAAKPIDMQRWAKKVNASEAVLACQGYEKIKPERLAKMKEDRIIRTNEINIWDAIKMEELVQQGDKFYLYPAILGETLERKEKTLKSGIVKVTEKTIYNYGLRQVKHWDSKDHDNEQLLKRVYDTLCIFELALDLSQFKDYSKKKNSEDLNKLLDN